MSLTSPFTVYAPGLAGVPKEEKFMSPGVVRRFVARGDANLTLRNVLRMLRQDGPAWNGFVDYMRSIFPGISIEIDFDENTDENIEVFFRPQWTRFPIDAAGTSILQASQIGAYIFLFRPRVLILDEPDSHLHPDNQRTLCELVSRLASERDFQAIISTHSRHVLDCLKDMSRIIWLSKGAIVDQPDINTTEVLLDLGALDSVDYFADGETRCVVATEDTDKDALKAILWSNGFVPDDTEVASYAGSSKADAAIVLGQFLTDKAPHVKLVIHRDRDYMSNEFAERFTERLVDAHIHPMLTSESDIESYFLMAGHISAVNPFLSVERAQELLDIATNETRERSIEAMINLRTEEAFKRRQQGQGNPNHGQIAMTAAADYDANPTRYRRGKIVVKRLKTLLNQEMNGHGQIFAASPFLIRPELLAIKTVIWPPA